MCIGAATSAGSFTEAAKPLDDLLVPEPLARELLAPIQ
jgi:hypothetical protein